MALLQHRDLSHVLFNSEDDELGFQSLWGSRRNRQPKDPNRFPKVPSDEGTKLMRSGAFGANDYDIHVKKRICRRMLDRELGLGDREQRKRNNDIVMQVSANLRCVGLAASTAPTPPVHDTRHEGRADCSLR